MGFNPLKPFSKFNPQNRLGELKNTIKREVLDEVKRDVVKPLEKEIKRVENAAEKVAKDVLNEILEALASEAFKKYVGWLDTLRPSTAGLSLGPVSFEYVLTDERLRMLKRQLKSVVSKHTVKDLIKSLAPDTVTLSVSAHIALGVGVNELGVGGYVVVPTKRFLATI